VFTARYGLGVYIQFRLYSAFKGCVMTQAVSRQPFTLETQVRCQARLGEACDGLSKAGISCFQCTSVCCCQRHAPALLSSDGQVKVPSKTLLLWTEIYFTCYVSIGCYNFTPYFQSRPLSLVSSYPRDHPSSKLLHTDGRTLNCSAPTRRVLFWPHSPVKWSSYTNNETHTGVHINQD
jgi:hypothetical protein